MQYESLSTVYYKNPGQYEQLYNARFSGEHTVHLPVKIHGARAFFCLVPELLSLTEAIHRVDKEIIALWKKLPQKSRVRHYTRSLIEEALWTNDIEGIHSSRQELRKAFDAATEKSNQKAKFKGLLIGYIGMLNHDLVAVKTPQDIRKIYDLVLLDDIAGEDRPDGDVFRKGSVSVMSTSDKELHKGILPESDLIAFVSAMLSYVEQEHHSLVSIAAFHYLFGYAHPFYDGNGRMARFLSSLFLSENLHILIGWNMSQTISEAKNAYYKAFDVCNNPRSKGDLTPFVLYYLSMVAQSAEGIRASLEEATARYKHYTNWSETITEGTTGEVLDTLLEVTLFSDKGIGTGGISRYLGISIPTVSRNLQRLQEIGIPIVVELSGRKKLYQLDLERIDQLEKSA
ncbi:MAG: Fic family protein [Betaproteobacteria bacterium]|nr:Fic family protein [Betaproteobacteria bacterium]